MDTRLKRLYEAAYAGDVDSLNECLEEDKLLLDRVITTTEVSDYPLHIAAFRGHASFARKILQQKPELARDFNAQGMSPLHLAAAEGHLRVVEELLQVDADLCYIRENKNGYLPVHIAVMKGRRDIVTLLIEKRKDSVNVITYSSETLLHVAIKAKQSEMVELLTKHGVTKLVLNAKDRNHNSSLHLAFFGRQQNVINHLLSHAELDVNVINSAGLTPLDVLLVTNYDMGDLYLGEILRAAGGKTAKELKASETILIDMTSTDAHNTSTTRVLSSPSNHVKTYTSLTKSEEKYDSISNLMLVATLVATVTFAAALNPPGGSIQMPFEDKDRTDTEYFKNWKHMDTLYPAGSPVFLWELGDFFYYDCLALLLSVAVILICLSGIVREILIRKIMILTLWMSIFFMVTAFFSAMKISFYTRQNYPAYFTWLKKADDFWNYLFRFAIGSLIGQAISHAIEERPSYLGHWIRKLCDKIYSSQQWVQNKLGSIFHVIILFSAYCGIGWVVGKGLSALVPPSVTKINE